MNVIIESVNTNTNCVKERASREYSGLSRIDTAYIQTEADMSKYHRAYLVNIQNIKEVSKSEQLNIKFKKQLDKFSSYIESKEEYELLFKKVIDDVLSFGFPDIKVKLSLNDSFTFYLKGKSYYELSFEVFKCEEEYNIVYSLYYKDSLISRDSGGLDFVKNEINLILRVSSNSSVSRDYNDDIVADTRCLAI
jgi:hypothetical protein